MVGVLAFLLCADPVLAIYDPGEVRWSRSCLRDRVGALDEEGLDRIEDLLEDLWDERLVWVTVDVLPAIGPPPSLSVVFRNPRGVHLVVGAGEGTARMEIDPGWGLDAAWLAGRLVEEKLLPAWRRGSLADGMVAAFEGLAVAARRFPPERHPLRAMGRFLGWASAVLLVAFALAGTRRWKPVRRTPRRPRPRIVAPARRTASEGDRR